jgi:hypothetical protein
MAESVKPAGDRVVRLVPRTEVSGGAEYREVLREADEFVEGHGCDTVAIFVIGTDGELMANFGTADRVRAVGMLFEMLQVLAGRVE